MDREIKEAKPWEERTLAELEIRKKYDKSWVVWSVFWFMLFLAIIVDTMWRNI